METRRIKRNFAMLARHHELEDDMEEQQDQHVSSDAESVDADSDYYEAKSGHPANKSLSKRLHDVTRATAPSNTNTTTRVTQRQPTRRPDPNVSNRNALMARENRKRKKEMMATLEQENASLQKDLQGLQKLAGRQEVIIRGLRNERNYLKSVLENQSEIVTLLKRLQPENNTQHQKRTTTQRMATNQKKKQNHSISASPNSVYSDSGMSFGDEGSPSHQQNYEEEDVNNNNYNDCVLESSEAASALVPGPLDAFMDFGCDNDLFLSAPVGDILNFKFAGAVEEEEEEGQTQGEESQWETTANGNLQTETIRSEHNYVYPNVSLIPHDNTNAVVVVKNPSPCASLDHSEGEEEEADDDAETDVALEDGGFCDSLLMRSPNPAKRPRCSGVESVAKRRSPGICLHIGGGKVSIEFCAQCHASATRDWHVKRL